MGPTYVFNRHTSDRVLLSFQIAIMTFSIWFDMLVILFDSAFQLSLVRYLQATYLILDLLAT